MMTKAVPKNWALKISTLVVVTACFVVMGSALLISQNFKNILTLWGDDVQLTVYLTPDISEAGKAHLESVLKESAQVGEITLITQDHALRDFKSQMASYAPDITQDEELLKLIPASFHVKLAAEIPASDQSTVLQSLALKMRGLEGVEEVTYGQDWIEKYSALVKAIEITLQLLGFIILAAALFVISNAVRASVQNRKEEIVVLEMIGATFAMIRRPFLIEGALLGLSSSLLGIVFCFTLYTGLRNLLISHLSFLQLVEHVQFLSIPSICLFLAFGTALGALASYLCVRRINDGFAGSQR